MLRSDKPLERIYLQKISLFCDVKPDCVIENRTVPTFMKRLLCWKNLDFLVVCRELHIDVPKPDLKEWEQMVERIRNRSRRYITDL